MEIGTIPTSLKALLKVGMNTDTHRWGTEKAKNFLPQIHGIFEIKKQMF
jgi:hypothetical protein